MRHSRMIATEARHLVRLGLPLIGAQLAGMGAIFVDTVFSGRLGASTLAAVAIGAGIWSAVNVVLVGVLVAVQASVAHLDGAQEHAAIGPVTRQGLWIGVALATGGILVTTHTEPLLRLMRIPSALIPTVDGYLSALAWGIPAWCAFLLLRFMSEGIGKTRPTLYFSLVGLIVNIPADAILMYGLFGFPALGARGCGYATALVFWAELGAMAVYVAFHPHYRHIGLYRPIERPDPRQIAELLNIGVPIAVALFMEVSMFTVAALLLGSLGATVIAAHQVALNFAALSFMIPLGLSMAITVRVGNAVGRKDPMAVRRASLVGIGLALVCQVVSATAMFAFPRAIGRLYTHDPAVISLAVKLLFLAGIFQLSDGIQVSSAGALRGLKDTRIPMLLTAVAYWLIGLPLGYYLAFDRSLGARGMWMGLIAGLTTAAALLLTRLLRVLARPLARRESAS